MGVNNLKITLLFFLLFSILAAFQPKEAIAGQVVSIPLSHSVFSAKRIVVATVRSIVVGSVTVYEVQVLKDLLNIQPAGDAEFYFRYPKITNDQPEGSPTVKSVYVECSGDENLPKPGENWIFISSQESGQSVNRVEPISSEVEIRALLDGLPKARP